MVTVIVEWLKDGAEGDEIVSRLEVIEVGTDEDGEPITSCVVEPADGEGAPAAARRVKLPDSARIALYQLQNLVSEHGEPAPASNHIPQDISVVQIELWRNYCEMAGMTSGESESANRQAFKRAKDKLHAVGVVGIWGQQGWLANGSVTP